MFQKNYRRENWKERCPLYAYGENFRHPFAKYLFAADDANLTSATLVRYIDLRFRVCACIYPLGVYIPAHMRILRIVRYTLRIRTIPLSGAFVREPKSAPPIPLWEEATLVMDVKRMRLGPFFILYGPIHVYTYRRPEMPRSKRAFVAIYFARGNGNGIASAARPGTRIVFRRCKWTGRQIYMAATYIYSTL